MMYLVQLLLPLTDNQDVAFPAAPFHAVREELTRKFGGMTAFTRAPAEGLWKDSGEVAKDDIVVFEVMVQTLDRAWWSSYKQKLEKRFAQDEIILRAQDMQLL